MPTVTALPAPCILCGGSEGTRDARGPVCAVCGWRVGDTVDTDLPLPRVEVVYYLRWDDRIKIGTSGNPRQRLGAVWHQELLAFERGGRVLERQRHTEFADLRLGGEWFQASARLQAHASALRGDTDPWHRYARWFSEAVVAVTA